MLYSYVLKLSGLEVNLAKSELVPMGTVDNVDGLLAIFDCRVSSLSLKYFGLPLEGHFIRPSLFGMV